MSTVCEEFVPTMLDNQVTQQPDWNESNSQQKTRLVEKNPLEKTTVTDKPPEKMVMQKDNQVIRII